MLVYIDDYSYSLATAGQSTKACYENIYLKCRPETEI